MLYDDNKNATKALETFSQMKKFYINPRYYTCSNLTIFNDDKTTLKLLQNLKKNCLVKNDNKILLSSKDAGVAK